MIYPIGRNGNDNSVRWLSHGQSSSSAETKDGSGGSSKNHYVDYDRDRDRACYEPLYQQCDTNARAHAEIQLSVGALLEDLDAIHTLLRSTPSLPHASIRALQAAKKSTVAITTIFDPLTCEQQRVLSRLEAQHKENK